MSNVLFLESSPHCWYLECLGATLGIEADPTGVWGCGYWGIGVSADMGVS